MKWEKKATDLLIEAGKMTPEDVQIMATKYVCRLNSTLKEQISDLLAA
jgi:hypothetical protein